jgi:hypothetical protein
VIYVGVAVSAYDVATKEVSARPSDVKCEVESKASACATRLDQLFAAYLEVSRGGSHSAPGVAAVRLCKAHGCSDSELA